MKISSSKATLQLLDGYYLKLNDTRGRTGISAGCKWFKFLKSDRHNSFGIINILNSESPVFYFSIEWFDEIDLYELVPRDSEEVVEAALTF